MKKALIHLITVSGLVIIWTAVAVLLLRVLSDKSPYQPLDHPLIKNHFYLMAKGAGEGEAPSNSYLALSKITKLHPDIIAEIDLWLTKDQKWVIYNNGIFKTTSGKIGKIHEYSLKDLKKKNLLFGPKHHETNLSLLTLYDVLSFFPQTTFLLDIHHYEEKALHRLLKLVETFQAGQRVLVHSSFPQVLRVLKKNQPRWLYLPSQPEMIKSQVMSAIFLETLLKLPFDFIFHNLTDKRKKLPPRLHKEALRRKKKVIAIVTYPHQLQESQLNFLDGVITPRPSEFISYLKK